MSFETHLVLGGPGAGKTQRLMDIVKEYLSAGVPPEKIAFVSFTRKAVTEAAERAAESFGLTKDDLMHFRTLHSMAYATCGIRREDVFGVASHMADLAEATCCQFSRSEEVTPFGGSTGDRGMFIDSYARSTCRDLYSVWQQFGEGIRWPWLQWFSETLRVYKSERFLLDFTDMLSRFVEARHKVDVDVAIIDEAQDLSPLQWKTVWCAFRDVRKIHIAGDDDQAIYKWSGADIEQFLNLKIDTKEVLPVSWRLSQGVFDYSQKLIRKVKKRYSKEFATRHCNGSVKFHRYLSSIPLTRENGSWLLLARNKAHLRKFESFARDQGVLFSTKQGPSVNRADINAIIDFEKMRHGETVTGIKANGILKRAGKKGKFDLDLSVSFTDLGLPDRIWHQVFEGIAFSTRNYYLALLRKGVDIKKQPEIHIDTIHAVKGGEADHVAIISDMTQRSYQNLQYDSDDEFRVWYVGITRTKGDLHVLLPETLRAYPV